MERVFWEFKAYPIDGVISNIAMAIYAKLKHEKVIGNEIKYSQIQDWLTKRRKELSKRTGGQTDFRGGGKGGEAGAIRDAVYAACTSLLKRGKNVVEAAELSALARKSVGRPIPDGTISAYVNDFNKSSTKKLSLRSPSEAINHTGEIMQAYEAAKKYKPRGPQLSRRRIMPM